LRDRLQGQIRQAAVGNRLGMIRRPGRLPDRGTSDFQPDRDFGKLGSDRLMFDERSPSLHAQVRKT